MSPKKKTAPPPPALLPPTVERTVELLDLLEARHPDAKLALDFASPFQLLIATILAAQAQDAVINTITPGLFQRWPTPADWAAAPMGELTVALKNTGYFNQKAKAVQGASQALVDRHGGQVPADMAALVALPGVGRKTANVILGNAFGQPDRIAVDTHVKRLADRLGLSRAKDALDVETELAALIPAERRTRACHLLQYHGRRVCQARKPLCDQCTLAPLCPSAGTIG